MKKEKDAVKLKMCNYGASFTFSSAYRESDNIYEFSR